MSDASKGLQNVNFLEDSLCVALSLGIWPSSYRILIFLPLLLCSLIPLQPLQTARKSLDEEYTAANLLPVNIANGSINISMSKMASGLSKQAAELPKIASISPSLSLPKIQPTNGNHHAVGAGHHGLGHHGHGHHGNGPGAALAGEAAAAATASTQAVGEAVNQVCNVIEVHNGNNAAYFRQNSSDTWIFLV